MDVHLRRVLNGSFSLSSRARLRRGPTSRPDGTFGPGVRAVYRYLVTPADRAMSAGIGLAIWIGGVFVAAREPRRRRSSAGTASTPQHPAVTDEPQRKAA
jgi:hypothetical protein